ncbi:MAG: CBS domain-containing protein [Halieaceae bacterium]
MFTVAEIMNTELITLGPDDNLREARRLMSEHHIRHIPVVSENQRLIGLVSQRDVLAAADSSLLAGPDEIEAEEQYVAVSSVMSVSVNTIDEGANLRGAALYLQKHKIGCLPVVRKEKLVGIVTDSDFVGVAINLMEQLEDRDPPELEEIA